MVETEPAKERRPGRRSFWLRDRIGELGDLLDYRSPEEVFAYIYNGAFALESVPNASHAAFR